MPAPTPLSQLRQSGPRPFGPTVSRASFYSEINARTLARESHPAELGAPPSPPALNRAVHAFSLASLAGLATASGYAAGSTYGLATSLVTALLAGLLGIAAAHQLFFRSTLSGAHYFSARPLSPLPVLVGALAGAGLATLAAAALSGTGPYASLAVIITAAIAFGAALGALASQLIFGG